MFKRPDIAKWLTRNVENWKENEKLKAARTSKIAKNLFESVGYMDAMNTPKNWSKLEGAHEISTLPVVKIAVSMSIDGFNPFPGSKRSIWPVLFAVLNLPESIRMKYQMLILNAIMPGPNKPEDIQPYMHVVVDELEILYREGIKVIDASDGNKEKIVRVKLLYTVADGPAQCSLTNMQGVPSAYPCTKCEMKVCITAFIYWHPIVSL